MDSVVQVHGLMRIPTSISESLEVGKQMLKIADRGLVVSPPSAMHAEHALVRKFIGKPDEGEKDLRKRLRI